MTLSQVLRAGQVRSPRAIAVQLGNLALTYEQFFQDVESVAAHLIAHGIRPGQIVATDIRSPVSHWLVLLGLMRAGAVSVSLTDRSAAEIDTLRGLSAVICGPDDTREYPNGLQRIDVGKGWIGAAPDMLARVPAAEVADRTAGRISFTSGTTGNPKAIFMDSQRLQTRLAGTARRTCIDSRSVLWCGLGPDTAYGFAATVATWAEGGTVLFSQGGRGAYRYLAERQLNLVVASPAALDTLLRDALAGSVAPLRGQVIVAGGRLSVALRDAVRERLCERIHIAFGASETGGVSFGSADALDRHPGHVGQLFSDVQARIVDEDGAVRPIGETGYLQVRNDSSVTEYLDDPQASARHFRDGWFQSGDHATLTVDGELLLLGRPSDILNLGGVKIAADEMDAAAREHPEVADACCLLIETGGIAPRLAVIVVGVLRDPAGLASRLRAKLPTSREILMLAAEAIPRGSMGKVNRQALADRVTAALEGAPLDESSFRPELIGIFSEGSQGGHVSEVARATGNLP